MGDDGPGPPIKYQYAELGKLYQVVSTLARCCDVSALAQSATEGQQPLANPYMDPALNLALLWVEVSEHGRHLSQYFSLFAIYASLGVAEKTKLLKLNVASLLMSVALDDGPGPPIKYQYAEL